MSDEAAPPSLLRPPLLADRYVLTRRIGTGGTANAYLAFDLQLNRWRAAKIMHRRFAGDAEMRERFDREARMMARIDHRNVVRVLDVSMGELPYLMMEYMEGGCVLDWMRVNTKMAPRLAVKVTVDLLRALEATHAMGIIHRDVKPHNVLVGRNGRCKLTDYGISKLVHEASDGPDGEDALTRVGSSMGTASFMPPEQRHDASSVDVRADVYAVGATLFTFLQRKAGKDLFIADADDGQFKGMPEALRDLVLMACRYQPEDRYPTAKAMREALEGLVPSLDDVPHPPFPGELPELSDRPPEGLLAEQAAELRELVVEGAVVEAYDASTWAPPEDDMKPVRPSLDVAAYASSPPPTPPRDATPAPPPAPTPAPAPAAHPTPAPAPSAVPGERQEAPAATGGSMSRILVGVGLVTLVLWLLGTAAVSIQMATSAADTITTSEQAQSDAAKELFVVLDEEAGLVQLLVERGGDQRRLEEAYFAFRDASSDRAVLAEAYGTVLGSQYTSVTARMGSSEAIERSWRRVEASRAAYQARRDDTQRAREGMGASLAEAFGLL